jgi:hypothetical protein
MNSNFQSQSRKTGKSKKKMTKSTKTPQSAVKKPKENLMEQIEGIHTKLKRETTEEIDYNTTGLPDTYVMELMKDFKDITSLNKENFFEMVDRFLEIDSQNDWLPA